MGREHGAAEVGDGRERPPEGHRRDRGVGGASCTTEGLVHAEAQRPRTGEAVPEGTVVEVLERRDAGGCAASGQ